MVESSFLTMCVFPSGNGQQGVGSIIKRCRTDLYQCIKLLLFFKKKKKKEYEFSKSPQSRNNGEHLIHFTTFHT